MVFVLPLAGVPCGTGWSNAQCSVICPPVRRNVGVRGDLPVHGHEVAVGADVLDDGLRAGHPRVRLHELVEQAAGAGLRAVRRGVGGDGRDDRGLRGLAGRIGERRRDQLRDGVRVGVLRLGVGAIGRGAAGARGCGGDDGGRVSGGVGGGRGGSGGLAAGEDDDAGERGGAAREQGHGSSLNAHASTMGVVAGKLRCAWMAR
jgi:hypothetical protein